MGKMYIVNEKLRGHAFLTIPFFHLRKLLNKDI